MAFKQIRTIIPFQGSKILDHTANTIVKFRFLYDGRMVAADQNSTININAYLQNNDDDVAVPVPPDSTVKLQLALTGRNADGVPVVNASLVLNSPIDIVGLVHNGAGSYPIGTILANPLVRLYTATLVRRGLDVTDTWIHTIGLRHINIQYNTGPDIP